MENTIGVIPNTFYDFQKKKIKSDTFENYKSFVTVEVQSQSKANPRWVGPPSNIVDQQLAGELAHR